MQTRVSKSERQWPQQSERMENNGDGLLDSVDQPLRVFGLRVFLQIFFKIRTGDFHFQVVLNNMVKRRLQSATSRCVSAVSREKDENNNRIIVL